jgi:hypothetical protein
MEPQGTILKNVVQFSGLVVGVPTSLPHLINVNGVAVIPQLAAADAPGYTQANVIVDPFNVTVTALPGAPSSVEIYLEHWHTIEDVTPPGNLAGMVPFMVASGGGGARAVLASATVDGTVPAFFNVQTFTSITRNGPAGDYLINNGGPGTNLPLINFSTGVLALDSKPTVLTVMPWSDPFFRVMTTHLDGTPVDCYFSLVAISAR